MLNQPDEMNIEEETCPICLEVPSAEATALHGKKFYKINGCGHELCWECEPRVRTMGHDYSRPKIPELNETLLKCPICRATEKPSYEQLERLVEHLRSRPTNNNGYAINDLQSRVRNLHAEQNRIQERHIANLNTIRQDLQARGLTLRTVGNRVGVEPMTTLHPLVAEVAGYNPPTPPPLIPADRMRDPRPIGRMPAPQNVAVPVARRIHPNAEPQGRVWCQNAGCNTPQRTQRRCPNHANRPCCRRCDICTECRNA